MASINDAKILMYNAFTAGWSGRTPIAFDNEEFTQPDISWVRVTVRNRVSNQETLGKRTNRKFLRLGAVFVQVFTPIDEGTAESDELAEAARNIFEGERLSGEVWFTNVETRETGSDGNMYQTLVEALFTYEQIK